MNYSLRQLKVFVTVARARSFSRAGEMIGLSQSAVSHSVKELEHQTGVRLLDRTTREVVLTEAGQQLAGRLERLLDELTITLRDAGRVGQQLSGQSDDFRSPYSAVYCSQQSSLSRYRFCAARSAPAVGAGEYPPGGSGFWHRD